MVDHDGHVAGVQIRPPGGGSAPLPVSPRWSQAASIEEAGRELPCRVSFPVLTVRATLGRGYRQVRAEGGLRKIFPRRQNFSLQRRIFCYNGSCWSGGFLRQASHGPVAQLGARSVRIREVEGSNPFRSTNPVPGSRSDWLSGTFFVLLRMQRLSRSVFGSREVGKGRKLTVRPTQIALLRGSRMVVVADDPLSAIRAFPFGLLLSLRAREQLVSGRRFSLTEDRSRSASRLQAESQQDGIPGRFRTCGHPGRLRRKSGKEDTGELCSSDRTLRCRMEHHTRVAFLLRALAGDLCHRNPGKFTARWSSRPQWRRRAPHGSTD